MALAGHSEWVIQVFGRWASSTVLRYVRTAILGAQGGQIAQTTEASASSLAVVSKGVKRKALQAQGQMGESQAWAPQVAADWVLERAAGEAVIDIQERAAGQEAAEDR